MKKRNIVLFTFTAIILIAVFSVIHLSIKNGKLKFISDDARQVDLALQIYSDFINSTTDGGNATITGDLSTYVNFINYTAYTQSNKEKIQNLFDSFTCNDTQRDYTISSEFNVKKLTLTLTLSNNNVNNIIKYTYKLKVNKKENKIDYKELKNKEYIVE